MRFKSLHMRAFGTFTDYELSFGGAGGLHLVFGANGAGKSTTLEALRSVLYGIAPKKKVHASSDLRVGATLERSDGQTIEYMRRTSPKTPLWNESDDQPMAIEELSPFLGNLERTGFETLFGLDYETMVAGGNALLEGKGEIGRALFGAMLGGQRLRNVTDRLENELKDLYVDRSSKGRINELVKEYKEVAANLKKVALRPASHQDDRRKLKALLAEHEVDVAARERARAQAEELISLRRSAISLAQLESRQAERDSLGELKPLDEATARRVQDLFRERARLKQRADERAREVSELEEATARANALASPEFLARGAAIEALAQGRGAFRDAVAARTKLQRQLDEACAARVEAIRQTGAENLTGTESDESRVAWPGNASLDEHSDAADRLSRELAERTSARKIAHEQVCRAEPVTRSATDRLDGIEVTLSRKLAAELSSLAPFQGTLAELLGVNVPSEADIERREQEERGDASREETLASEFRRSEIEAREAREALEQLAESVEGPPPTLEEIQTAREKRDEHIGSVFGADAREACNALDVQRSVHAADDLADRRARESARAAEREAQEGALQRASASMEELRSSMDAAREEAAARSRGWNGRLAQAGLGPMPASALRSWCARRNSVLREAQSGRDAAAHALEQALAQEADHRARLKAADDELSAVRSEWTQWAQERSLDPGAGPESAQRRLRMLVGVHAADREIARLKTETTKRDEAASSFERSVASLCDELDVRPTDRVLEAALETAKAEGIPEGVVLAETRMDGLSKALHEAGQAKSELQQLAKSLKAQKDASDVATKRGNEVEQALADLAQDAECSSLAAILQLAEQSERARSLDADIRRTESELKAEHGDQVNAATLRETIGDRTVDDLNEALKEAQAEARALDAAISERAREEGLLRGRVESKGSAEPAHLRSRMAQIEAELNCATADFLNARLADELLRREIERNRQETHGPLLQRAQELFKVLTLGAYQQLHPSESQSGKQVMVARRPDGRQVGVDEMSSGTCDQLYLALRIASVEHMLKTIEPMPFIADDLFVNFDDDRTEAALRVLAELSKSTQVIVFSHHGSVVETALRLTDEGVPVDVLRLKDERRRESERME